MTRNLVIKELQAWIEDEPVEANDPSFFDIADGQSMSIVQMLTEVVNNTHIGQAFVRCYYDAVNGVI
jgi:hypothetical protein